MRMQFEFSAHAVEELETLKKVLNARSRGDVINHAIGVLKWLINEKREQHSRIVVERPDSGAIEAVFPQLEAAMTDKKEKVKEMMSDSSA